MNSIIQFDEKNITKLPPIFSKVESIGSIRCYDGLSSNFPCIVLRIDTGEFFNPSLCHVFHLVSINNNCIMEFFHDGKVLRGVAYSKIEQEGEKTRNLANIVVRFIIGECGGGVNNVEKENISTAIRKLLEDRFK